MNLYTLGPAGTSSHDAAVELFPDAAITLMPNFDSLFETLQKNNEIGFVPVENSLHGSVVEVLDLLLTTDLKMWRTYDVAIHYAFGGLNSKKISKIASHPQALAHCREYLHANYPLTERFPVSSTAYAIELGLKDETIGVIARESTMAQRNLPIIQKDVHRPGNTTRFAIIAKKDPFPDNPKTHMGILIHPPKDDRPGLLHLLLTPFKVYDVNLTRIENRPTGKKLGDYNFFVDFIGSPDDARTNKVLEELSQLAEIRILGEW
jgi:prephenate dehydratase